MIGSLRRENEERGRKLTIHTEWSMGWLPHSTSLSLSLSLSALLSLRHFFFSGCFSSFPSFVIRGLESETKRGRDVRRRSRGERWKRKRMPFVQSMICFSSLVGRIEGKTIGARREGERMWTGSEEETELEEERERERDWREECCERGKYKDKRKAMDGRETRHRKGHRKQKQKLCGTPNLDAKHFSFQHFLCPNEVVCISLSFIHFFLLHPSFFLFSSFCFIQLWSYRGIAAVSGSSWRLFLSRR